MEKDQTLQLDSTDELSETNRINDRRLVTEIGEWTNRNFSYHNPWLGMIEEMGEITHCLLKRSQKIRGYDDEEKFIAEYSDALADFCIYGGHYAFLNPGEKFCLDTIPTAFDAENIISHLLWILSEMKIPNPVLPSQLGPALSHISMLAYMEGLDLREITYATWEKVVSKRNWVKDPLAAK